jgi:ribonuclease VapC
MTSFVVDSSIIIALINKESGFDIAEKFAYNNNFISTVNYSEILYFLRRMGMDGSLVGNYSLTIIDFDREYAVLASELGNINSGLSFGDRACLALAKNINLPVVTADRAWKNLDIGVEIILIR